MSAIYKGDTTGSLRNTCCTPRQRESIQNRSTVANTTMDPIVVLCHLRQNVCFRKLPII